MIQNVQINADKQTHALIVTFSSLGSLQIAYNVCNNYSSSVYRGRGKAQTPPHLPEPASPHSSNIPNATVLADQS